MTKLIVFLFLSTPIVFLSWKSLKKIKSHGFFRFFAWECILWLFVSNIAYWFNEPFSLFQIISWILLFGSIYPVTAGTIRLKKYGRQESNRDGQPLYQFEKTTRIVDSGIYRYIRHPLYLSLILLTWGIF